MLLISALNFLYSKLMNKVIKSIFILGLFSLLSPVILAEESCSEGVQNQIIIHGIGGSKSSFGFMNQVLDKNLTCSKSHFFEYDTQNSQLTTLDFAIQLDRFLNSIPKTKEKDLNFIMHSQGGLVGLTFLINSFNKTHGFNFENLKRINKFVSMSTPFWGSDFALMGQSVFFSFDFESNGISPFGKTQLRDMKYGSEFFKNQITTFFQSKESDFLKFLKEEIQILNISGMAPYSRRLFSNGGTQFFEGDLIVNIPSMTLNTLSASANNLNYVENLPQVLETKESSFAKQAYVIGTHMDVYSGTLGYGIVDTPEDCLSPEECDHPGFNTLFGFLSKDEVKTNAQISKMVKGFELHVQIEFPENTSEIDEAIIRIENVDDEVFDLSNYRLNRNKHKSINTNLAQHNGYFLIKGSLLSSSSRHSIELEVSHPEIISRKVVVKVEKGKATFLSLSVRNKKVLESDL